MRSTRLLVLRKKTSFQDESVSMNSKDILNNLVLPIFSTFMGAFFAFRFGLLQSRREKREENLSNLIYSCSSLSSLVNSIYNFKYQIVLERNKEVAEIERELGKHYPP